MTPEELQQLYPFAKTFSIDNESGELVAVDDTPVEEIQHKEWGDFAGSKLLRLNKDFKQYDIAHYPTYFCKESENSDIRYAETEFGKDKYSEAQHEELYFAVSSACQDSEEYVLDCWKGHYTVRPKNIIKRYHYQTMTAEEKQDYKFNFLSGKVTSAYDRCKSYLTQSDYLVQKLNEAANLDDSEEVARLKADHAIVYEQRKLARKAVNKLQEIKDLLDITDDVPSSADEKKQLTTTQIAIANDIEV